MIPALVVVLAAAPPPCLLSVKKDAIAAGHLEGVAYQLECSDVGARYLASDDPVERAAAAAYGERFRDAGKKTINVPIVSDFFGPLTVAYYQHYFALSRAQREKILAHAPDETNPLVLSEALRHFGALAGVDASLKLLRASPLVAADGLARRDAIAYWQFAPPKKLLPSELGAAWGFDVAPVVQLNAPVVDRSAKRQQRAEARLSALRPDDDRSAAWRELSEAGLGDRVLAAVVEDARRFVDAKQGDCFFLGPQVQAGSGHLPTLLKLAEVLKGCQSVFNLVGPLFDGLAHTPDPESAVLAALPVLADVPRGACTEPNALLAVVPADAKPSTVLAVARAFDANPSCLWSTADALADRLSLATGAEDPARKAEGVAAVVALGRLVAARDELWRHGDRLVVALARAKTDEAAAGVATLAALQSKLNGSVAFAAQAEAALYFIGGPQAEKRAAVMRRYARQ